MEVRPPIWFVTGASGFFGRRFTVAAAGREVRPRLRLLIHRTPVTPPPGNVEIISGSLDTESELAAGVRHAAAVIHFAGATHANCEEEYIRVNGAGTERLVRAAAAAGVKRFILISSRAIRPDCGAYARSKLQAERAVQASGIPYAILRFAEVYGPESREGLNALIRFVRVSPIVPYPAGHFELGQGVGTLAPDHTRNRAQITCQHHGTPQPIRRNASSLGDRFQHDTLQCPLPHFARAERREEVLLVSSRPREESAEQTQPLCCRTLPLRPTQVVKGPVDVEQIERRIRRSFAGAGLGQRCPSDADASLARPADQEADRDCHFVRRELLQQLGEFRDLLEPPRNRRDRLGCLSQGSELHVDGTAFAKFMTLGRLNSVHRLHRLRRLPVP